MPRKQNSRESILDAAEALVIEKGVNALATETVAMMSGLKKGGVLYHFRYKNDLLRGLLERHFERNRQALNRCRERADGDAFLELKYIVAFLLSKDSDVERSFIAIIAEAASNPELLEPIAKFYESREQHLLSRFKDPYLVAALLMAGEGFRFFNAISIPPVSETLRDGLMARLLDVIDDMRRAEECSPPD